MSQPNESSVEEILESIKKVIARDNREDAKETRRRRETKGVSTRASGPTADTDDNLSAPTAEEEVLDLAEMEFVEDIDAPTDTPSDEEVIPENMGSEEMDDQCMNNGDSENDSNAPLTNDNTRLSMRENLEALAMLSQPSVPPQIVRSGETSLEGLARDMLRPMLAEWLDDNLPSMVEEMVQAEIAQIARKGK